MRRMIIPFIILVTLLSGSITAAASEAVTCWFPPGWKTKATKAKTISATLSEGSGLSIRPRIAKSYPEIMRAFESGKPALVYVGSFVQAVLKARGTGIPLVQAKNGREFYASWMVYPKGQDPESILRDHAEAIAFTIGASSGESGAKAATDGKALLGMPNHKAASSAVKVGKAKAAFVKNWWWENNKGGFPELLTYQVAGVSDMKNPDNVLTASKAMPQSDRDKVTAAAMAASGVFGASEMAPFDEAQLDFSLALMKTGKLDPVTYSW